jgi:pantoate--beta-alanine ligase
VTPELVSTRAELAAAALPRPVVLVPTMGALHDGHRALLRRAAELARPGGSVVVSIFVNPLQFGQPEDLARYPRTLEEDLRVCAEEGAHCVFAPSLTEMYPQRQLITVDPGPVGEVLEGESRPGHFAGMLTVVLKLFNMVGPDVAVFGEKDAQQLALVCRMRDDFALAVRIEPVPTVRDADGLALSSRNKFLSQQERAVARLLPDALFAGAKAAADGPAATLAAAASVLGAGDREVLHAEYLALVDPRSYEPVPENYSGDAVLAVAARAGSTRLIDNVRIIFESVTDAADN